MKLKNIIEMTTSINVGSNVLPQRWLTKMLRRPNLSEKQTEYYTKINLKKGKSKWPKKVNLEVK